MVDLFSSEDGKRLFGFIAAGATIGAIVGSAVTASLARHAPTSLLLIGAALLLEVAVFSVHRLSRQSAKFHSRSAEQAAETPIGGNVFAGIIHPFKSSYLMNVSAFLLLFAITSTFLYFQQAGIVSRSFQDRGAQTAFFATIDLAVNALTLLVQLFLTGRIVRSLGVGPTLAFLPALTIVGFGVLALLPTIAALVTFQVLRRSSDCAADPRGPLHRASARGPLQGQELHRHRGLSCRRSGRGVVVRIVVRARPQRQRDRFRGRDPVGHLARQRALARPQAGLDGGGDPVGGSVDRTSARAPLGHAAALQPQRCQHRCAQCGIG